MFSWTGSNGKQMHTDQQLNVVQGTLEREFAFAIVSDGKITDVSIIN